MSTTAPRKRKMVSSETNVPLRRRNTDTLGFKAQSSGRERLLSNLYGGAEFDYMSQRTSNDRLRMLYLQLRNIDWDQNYELFKNLRGMLMGKKTIEQYVKIGYKDPYKKDGKVAGGLIAKLISGCFRPNMTARLAKVNELANAYLGPGANILKSDFEDGTREEKKTWMLKALRRKFIMDMEDKTQHYNPRSIVAEAEDMAETVSCYDCQGEAEVDADMTVQESSGEYQLCRACYEGLERGISKDHGSLFHLEH